MSSFRQLMMRNKGGSNILYAPALDGTEQITTLQGQNSPHIENHTLTGQVSSGKGGAGYLSKGWDNTVLWQLTFKARIVSDAGILFACDTTQRDYNCINMTASDYYAFNLSSYTRYSYSPSLRQGFMVDVVITKIDNTTLTIKVGGGNAVMISNFTALQTDRCYIGVDCWAYNSYGIISDILVTRI